MTVETVYNLRDNINIVNFTDGSGAAIDFTAASRMVMKFDGSLIVADTDIDPTLIDFSAGGGDITFLFNDLGIAEAEYPASLIVYDASHPDGQIIVHANNNDLFFRFVDPV